MISYENRCKERHPLQTIKKIENILLDLGVLVKTIWYEPAEGVFSVHLKINGTDFYTNGKGSSEEFALASAYGELMERLQNLVPYRFSKFFDFYDIDNEFKVDVKEQVTNRVDDEEEQKKYFRKIFLKDEYENYIMAWNDVYAKKKVISQLYRNINNEKDIISIPEIVFATYYGSNGMASGNTYAEAFVQAMSEIFERYAVKKIISEKLVPPDITDEVFMLFPRLKKMEEAIREKNENIHLRIKDINLGMGLPVYAVIYSDCKNNNYFVNFGAHPNVEVAIERCITELYQGQSHVEINNATSIAKNSINIKENMFSIFCTGEGVYPVSFFGGVPSYERIKIEQFNFKSNEEMSDFYLKLVSKLNMEIFYKDVGFLGIPAISIVIPNMSEAVLNVADMEMIDILKEYVSFPEKYCSLNSLKDEEINSMIMFIKNKRIDENTSLDDILRIPIKSQYNHFADITLDLFLAMLYIRTNDYCSAKRFLDQFIEYIKKNGGDEYSVKYNT